MSKAAKRFVRLNVEKNIILGDTVNKQNEGNGNT